LRDDWRLHSTLVCVRPERFSHGLPRAARSRLEGITSRMNYSYMSMH
jgi:hypothetical protein